MRIETLLLERYGVFQDRLLDFSGDRVRLHVIHGPNEAGKSTALSAICDLLFGIPEQTGYAFACDYATLRIGATLTNRAGGRLTFKRRKGRSNTLLDAQGTPLPDGGLASFLGGIDRAGFERRFGLDYDRLRQGGDQMREAKGDLARSLFEAGSGLPTVIPVLERLKAEADELGSPLRRAASKPLYKALDALTEAQARLRSGALRPEDWSRAVEAEAEARRALEDLAGQLADLRRRRSRVQRLAAARPILARLDMLREQRAALGDGPDLPASFAEDWRRQEGERHLAAADRDRLLAQRADLDLQGAALPEPGPLPAHGPRIERLFQASGRIDTLRADLPKLERDLEHSDQTLAQYAAELGLASNPAAARPTQLVVARIRDAMAQRGALDLALASAAERQAAASAALTQLEAERAGLGEPADPAAAAAALAEAQAEGEVETRLAEAEQKRRQAEKLAATEVGRLGLWRGEPEALVALPVPTAERMQRFALDVQALDGEIRQGVEALERLEEDGRRTEAELRSLEAEGEIPTAEALAGLRRRRDRLWSRLRRRHMDGGGAGPESEAPEDEAPPTPEGFESLLRQADALADRREREAHRVSRHQALTTRLEALRAEEETWKERLAALERQRHDGENRWRELWRDSGIAPEDPVSMQAWLQRRDKVLRAVDDITRADTDCGHLRSRAQTVRGHLSRAAAVLELPEAEGLDLPALRAAVRQRLDAAQRRWQQAERLRQERDKALHEREAAARAQAKAEAEDRQWQTAWAAQMPGIGLPPDASPADARTALEIWAKIEVEWVDRQQRQDRRDGIARDLNTHQAEVTAFAAQLGDARPEADSPLDLPKLLYARWKEAQALADRRAALTAQREETATALAAAERRLAAAQARLDALRTAHGLAAEADPLAAAARADHCRALADRLAEARHDLAAAGGGESEESLRAATAGLDPDALAADALAIEEAENALQLRRDEAARAHLRGEQELEAMRRRASDSQTGDGHSMAAAAQQARDAQQTAARHTARWARLWAAQTLLSTALERFRDANEHPLVRRASELLTMIADSAANPITRLTVDYGRRDLPVLVGLRRDGSRCSVEGMSDGTRDQLYLALRIAAIEAAAAETEPLPFIADDLFITSDDIRTLPGLKALAALGAHTQVLLFTHHRTVVEAARHIEAETPGSVRLHSLRGDEPPPQDDAPPPRQMPLFEM